MLRAVEELPKMPQLLRRRARVYTAIFPRLGLPTHWQTAFWRAAHQSGSNYHKPIVTMHVGVEYEILKLGG